MPMLRRVMPRLVLISMLLFSLVALGSCSNDSDRPGNTAAEGMTEAPPVYAYTIINTYPHDRQAFTQGLVLDQGTLYEGTGLRGQSSVRRVDLTTGRILQLRALPAAFFGEGITVFGPHLIQLTWQSKVGFVYDKTNFTLLRQFTYPTEGWGITHDDQRLIMSDGTSVLYFLDPETLSATGQLHVWDDQGPVARLNELEYVQGSIYANIWQTDRIARIDPESGQVTAWIDLTGLLPLEDRVERVDVLNGIAYDAARDRLFVTGKLWPKLFEIQIHPSP
jgi:glutaminyl-peptide cyclotransferase